MLCNKSPTDVISVWLSSAQSHFSLAGKFVHPLYYVTLNVVAESASQLRAAQWERQPAGACVSPEFRPEWGVCFGSCLVCENRSSIAADSTAANCWAGAVRGPFPNSEAERPLIMWGTWSEGKDGAVTVALASSWRCDVCGRRFESAARMWMATGCEETQRSCLCLARLQCSIFWSHHQGLALYQLCCTLVMWSALVWTPP